MNGCKNSSNHDTVLFKNISVFCDLAFNVLFCQLGELDVGFFLGITQLGLFLPLLLQSGGDGLVLPANFMGQSSKQGKLERKIKITNASLYFVKIKYSKLRIKCAELYGVLSILNRL